MLLVDDNFGVLCQWVGFPRSKSTFTAKKNCKCVRLIREHKARVAEGKPDITDDDKVWLAAAFNACDNLGRIIGGKTRKKRGDVGGFY